MRYASKGFAKLTQAQILCLIKRFERIKITFSVIFYTLSCLQLITGTLSVVAHAHEDDGLFGGKETVRTEGIIFSTLTEVLSGFLIIVPVHTSMIQCGHALEILYEYKLTDDVIPVKVLKTLVHARTLCFKNPFSYGDCVSIKNLVDADKKVTLNVQP